MALNGYHNMDTGSETKHILRCTRSAIKVIMDVGLCITGMRLKIVCITCMLTKMFYIKLCYSLILNHLKIQYIG